MAIPTLELPIELTQTNGQPLRLTEESAVVARKIMGRQIDSSEIVEQLPSGLSTSELILAAEGIAAQIGFDEVAGSIVRQYEEREFA